MLLSGRLAGFRMFRPDTQFTNRRKLMLTQSGVVDVPRKYRLDGFEIHGITRIKIKML
jgi:hypothetical protein